MLIPAAIGTPPRTGGREPLGAVDPIPALLTPKAGCTQVCSDYWVRTPYC